MGWGGGTLGARTPATVALPSGGVTDYEGVDMTDPTERLTPAEAVQKLDAIKAGDPERNHGDADDIILSVVPDEVREAYWRACVRDGRWWWA